MKRGGSKLYRHSAPYLKAWRGGIGVVTRAVPLPTDSLDRINLP